MPLTSLFQPILDQNQVDAALISSASQITYLTGYAGFSPLERDAYLLITRKMSYLFTSPLYAQEVKQKLQGMIVKVRTAKESFSQQFSAVVREQNLTKIGIEDENLTVAEYQDLTAKDNLELFPLSLSDLRIVKTSAEIKTIQKACAVGDQALEKIKNLIKPGMTEKHVALELEIAIRRFGAGLSFPTIVAFGKNSAVPHHLTDQTILQKNDTILIDFGVVYENYCSDMTRTFSIGKPTKEKTDVYQTVLEAQQKAVTYIKQKLKDREEINTSLVDKVARDYIVSKNYPSIPHSLGHGIGIDVHEAPSLSVYSKDKLKNGMVFSIEPGIYLPDNFGVRIEDLYAIQNNQLVTLTHSANNSL